MHTNPHTDVDQDQSQNTHTHTYEWGVISVSSPVFIFVEAFPCGGTKFDTTLATDSHSIGHRTQTLTQMLIRTTARTHIHTLSADCG